MIELSMAHKSALHEMLKEIAADIESLMNIIAEPKASYRILPILDDLTTAEREKMVHQLNDVRHSIELMCKEFGISFETDSLRDRVEKSASYLSAVAIDLFPVSLHERGELTATEKSVVTKFANNIMHSIEQIYKAPAKSV